MTTRTFHLSSRIALVLVSTLAMACGNITIPTNGQSASSGEKSAAKDQGQGAKKKDGVRLGLALPEDFKEGASDDEKAGDSDMAPKFEDGLADSGVIVTCDGEGELNWEMAKERDLKGIFELTIINWTRQTWDDEDVTIYEEEGKGDGEEGFDDEGTPMQDTEVAESRDEKFALHDEKDGQIASENSGPGDNDDEKQDCRDDDDDDDDGKVASENSGPGDGGLLAITHLAIPFVCEGNATIQLVGLDLEAKYSIDGALYAAEGALAYQGSSETFSPAKTTDVELVMSKVEVADGNVDVHVVFNDAEKEPSSTEAPPKEPAATEAASTK